MTAFTEDTANELKAQKRLTDNERYKKLQRDKAIGQLFGTKEGRTYLWNLLELTGVFGVNAFSPDPLATAFHCGKQYIGQLLMAHMLEVNPEGFSALLLEMNDDGRYRRSNQPNAGTNNGASRDLFADDGADSPTVPRIDDDRAEAFYD